MALCLLVFLTASPARATVSVTDDAGREIVLPQPATRVVALYGAFNEILAGMGMADRIVARTEADATPPSIAALPVIGTHMRPNLERVLAVKPDLVLQMAGRGEAEQAVEALSRLGVPVAVFSVTDFPGLYAAILRIGTLTGAKEAADSLVAALQERLAALVAKAAGKARSKVFFEVRSGSLLAAGKGSMVDAVIAAAGGENAVTAEKKIVRLADEELLRLAPDVCLTQRGPMNPEARPMTERPEYAALPCVKNGRAFLVDEALYSRPGPGSVDAAEALATLLAGDAKKEARP
ncbi:MAG TPA: iron ABC transporter substrate-binding protein [Desulfovibrio sp.]|nr:iron ABC transporter substrate-binding protein [Desulfovibrio sp.]